MTPLLATSYLSNCNIRTLEIQLHSLAIKYSSKLRLEPLFQRSAVKKDRSIRINLKEKFSWRHATSEPIPTAFNSLLGRIYGEIREVLAKVKKTDIKTIQQEAISNERRRYPRDQASFDKLRSLLSSCATRTARDSRDRGRERSPRSFLHKVFKAYL